MVGSKSGARECPGVGNDLAWRLGVGPRVGKQAAGTRGYKENRSEKKLVMD